MAGGTWSNQNKVRPGVYIRFKTAKAQRLSVGERGTVAIARLLSWGPVGVVSAVEAGADPTPYTGYPITNANNRFLSEIYKGTNRTNGAKKVLLYRLTGTGATQATAAVGELTVTAKYPGVRGNDITVVITEQTDNTFTVSTVVDGEIVDTQEGITAASGLTTNDWVTWSGAGAITASTGAALTGGTDGTLGASAYANFLAAIEPYKFDVLIYDGADNTTLGAAAAFVERMAEENGVYTQLVASGFTTNPDSRYVVNVASGVTLGDGTDLTAAQTTWWAGGALAGASYNESLTYANYPGAVSVSPLMTNSEYVDALKNGKFVLFAEDGQAKVEQDINTLVTYTEDIGKPFSKNRVMRLCSTIANDVYAQFSTNFIGAVNNNEAGRMSLKSAIVGYLLDIQGNQGIQNFSPDDVEIFPGDEIDAILVNIAIQPVDAVEKIYMTLELN